MKSLKPFYWISFGIVLACVLNILLMPVFIKDLSDRGSFGDMFGGINALFSGLAMAGVIIAIILQKTELGLQREELELTRKELAKTATANKQQAEIQKLSAEISGISSMLEVTTERLRYSEVKGGAGMNNVYYVPEQLLEFQDNYIMHIQKRVDKLTKMEIIVDYDKKNEK